MSGLIGWWPLNETSGSTARDLSGNGNHGTLNGGVTQGVAGKSGLTSYSFDGSSGMVSNSSTISGIGINTPCSITCWFYARSNGGVLVNYKNGSSDRFATSFNNGKINAAVYDGSWRGEKSAPATLNEWHHFAAVWDGDSKMRLYLDGNSVGSSGSSTSTRREAGTYIGRKQNGEQPFDGLVCDARLYNRILTSHEVWELYEQGSGDFSTRSLSDGSDSGAVSRWKFDSGADDFWGSNHGTLNGDASVGNSDSIRGGSLSLDGSGDYVGIGDKFNFDNSGDSYTISAWIKRASESGNRENFLGKTDGSSGWQFAIWNDDSLGPLVIAHPGKTSVETGFNVHANNWYHVVATYEGVTEKLRVYANGWLVESDIVAQPSSNNIEFRIGDRGDGNNSFHGLIDDVRIYNRALEPHEVFELYQWGTRGRDMRKQLVNKR